MYSEKFSRWGRKCFSALTGAVSAVKFMTSIAHSQTFEQEEDIDGEGETDGLCVQKKVRLHKINFNLIIHLMMFICYCIV